MKRRAEAALRALRRRNWLGWDVLVLAAITLIVGLLNGLWTHLELRPPHWDMARHLYNSLAYYDMGRGHQWFDLALSYWYYPPLAYWLVVPWYGLFGTSVSVAVASNVVFVGMLVTAVYATGRRLWGRTVGLTAAVVTIATPMFVSQFKEFQLDAPAAAMTMAALYGLIRSEGFGRRGWSAATGVMVGLGMLLKWTFGLLIGLPVAYAIGVAVVAAWRQRKVSRLAGVTMAAVWAYAIPSGWYAANQHQIRIDLLANGVAAGVREGDPAIGSWASNIWYVLNLVNVQLYLGLAVVLVIGTVVALRHRQRWSQVGYVVLGIVGIGIGFGLLRNKDPRYTLPMVPMIVLLGCAGLAFVGRRLRRWAQWGLVGYSVVMFGVVSFGAGAVRQDVALRVGDERLVVWGPHGYIIGRPSGERWWLEEAFEVMGRRPRPVAFNGSDTIWLNNWDVLYYGRRFGLPIVSGQEAAGYLVYRTTDRQPAVGGSWRVVRQFDRLPDGSWLILYERRD